MEWAVELSTRTFIALPFRAKQNGDIGLRYQTGQNPLGEAVPIAVPIGGGGGIGCGGRGRFDHEEFASVCGSAKPVGSFT